MFFSLVFSNKISLLKHHASVIYFYVLLAKKLLNKIYFVKLHFEMETQEHTIVIPLQQIPPAEVIQQALVVQRRSVNVSAAKKKKVSTGITFLECFL